MMIRIAVALIVAGNFVGQALSGERFTGTWWNGVVDRKGHFEPGILSTGRPALVSRATWKEEKLPGGTIIRVGKGRMTANFDMYNLTNSNTILSRNNTYSPTSTAWGTPASILAARLFKFGAQFDF